MIAKALERLEAVLEHRSDFGVSTSRSISTVTDGLCCATTEGKWETISDLPAALGGGGAAPTPGVLLRAALGSCIAMSYQLRAARHGVVITSIRVTVETDSELAGMLLSDASASPGFSEIRYHVEIGSPHPACEVLQILDEGDRLSPLLDVFNRVTRMHRTTSVDSGGA